MQANNLLTVAEAAVYCNFSYKTLMRKIKLKYDMEGILPAGVHNFADQNAKRLSLRIDIKEFKTNFSKVSQKPKLLINTYENCVKGINSSYFLTVSKNTKSNYINTIKHLKFFFEEQEEINHAAIYDFIDYLRVEAKFKEITIIKHLRVMNSLFNHSVKMGAIKNNPLNGFEKNILKQHKREVFLTKEQRVKLIKEAEAFDIKHKTSYADKINFAIETGMRNGEQTAIAWKNVNFKENGKAELYIPPYDTKTKKGRFVILSTDATNILLKAKTKGLSKPFTQTNFDFWNTIRSNASLSHFRWHDLRHTFATWCSMGWHAWLKEPMKIQVLQLLMGHQDIKETMHYTHHQMHEVEKIMIG